MNKVALLLALLLGVSAFAGTTDAAVNAGAITATALSGTQIKWTIDTAATEMDSLYVAYFTPYSSTDTTFVALLDSAATDTTITGFTPLQQVVAFLLARDGTGATAISNKDSLNTYRVQVGDNNKRPQMYRKAATDASWPFAGQTGYDLDTVFDLNGADASDYSLLYYAGAYNGIDVLATQAGDSTVATVYFYPVHVDASNADTTFVRGATVADSVQVTAAGLTRSSLSLAVGRFYQMLVYTLTGNGKDADFEIYYTSDDVR